MGDSTETIRPIWRTPLAAALAGWMAIVLGVTLASGRLMEFVPGDSILILALAVYVAPVPILLAWSFWAMLREPMTGWLAPTILLAFCSGFAPAMGLLLDVGTQLNFTAHRAAYAAIAAEAARNRALGDETGSVVGVRDGVRYRYRAAQPGEIDFVWIDSSWIRAGVRYDDTPCVASRGSRCVDSGRSMGGDYSFYRVIF